MELKKEVEYWYSELYRLMWAMVWDVADPGRFYLHPDDVFAELSEELVKVVIHYDNLPANEMKAVLIVSLRNRCLDLLHMEHSTHRAAEADIYSLDEGLPNVPGATLTDKLGRPSAEDSYFDVQGMLEMLSDDGWLLVEEILDPSERLIAELELTAMRKMHIASKGFWKLELNKRICQRALGWPCWRVDNAWSEVQEVLALI